MVHLELWIENNINIFKSKIHKIKSKNNCISSKEKQFFSSNLIINKNNINNIKPLCNRNIENLLCKFISNAKQKDLKYQLHNNAEFDNGIINYENESYQRNLNLC